MSQGYVTVFDATDLAFADAWASVLLGGAWIIFAVALWFKREAMMANRSDAARVVIAALNIWMAVGWTIFSAYRVGTAEAAIKAAIRDKTVQSAEGYVSRYKPHFGNGDFQERFCVQQACFHYFDYLPGPGFHASGVIEPNLQVRLLYVGNNIILLDVVPAAKHQQPAGPPPGVGME